jgi:chromosome transmission fidelity protein 4
MEIPDDIFSQDNKQPSQAMQPIPSQSIHQEQASVSKHS